MGVQEPLGVELIGVVTVERGIVVALPKIRDAHGPFGNEHAVVPDILGRVVGNANREGRTPTESLFDYGLYIRQVGSIRESRGTGAPDDGVELCLCTLLYFRASDHGKRPPTPPPPIPRVFSCSSCRAACRELEILASAPTEWTCMA